MKTILDATTREELIGRILQLTADSRPLWGTMTVGQMLRHCCLCEEYYYGAINIKRSLTGRILGSMALSRILRSDQAGFGRNAPTARAFVVTESVTDISTEQANWIRLIERYESYPLMSFTHWFFGKMTCDQLGQFVYKHAHHHLNQFGV